MQHQHRLPGVVVALHPWGTSGTGQRELRLPDPVLAMACPEWAQWRDDLGGSFQPTSPYIYRQLNPALGFSPFFLL